MAQAAGKAAYSGYTFVKSSGGIDEYTLQRNGLSVLLCEDDTAPVIGFMVTYRVGSRNEAIGYTGATHLLEHLMFKGSKNFNKDAGAIIFDLLEDKGALMNATTWLDRTNYFEVIAKEHIEDVVAAEADRMRNAFIDEKDRLSEMPVVRNEFERGENSALEALDKQMWAAAYQAHPYHHSTIGWRSDIENVPIERLRKFYDDFYWPNNATVTVAGDFDPAHMLDLIRKHFGVHSPSPHLIPVAYTEEPPQEGPRRVIVRRADTQQLLCIAHKIPHGRHKDAHALHLLAAVLGYGKTSRLYKKLVDTELATNVDISAFPFHDNSLFMTYVTLAPRVSHQKVEKIVLAEYQKIIKMPPSKEELDRIKTSILAEEVHSRDGAYEVLSRVNEAIAAGDWALYTNYLSAIRKVTPAQVKEVAARYLKEDQSTTGYFEGTARA